MMTNGNYLYVLLPSSFPFLSSINFFNLFLGIFFSLKFGFNLLFISLLSVSILGLHWWSYYVVELTEEGLSSFNMDSGLKFSFVLFICSEIFFFFSFFWGYFHFTLSPMMELSFLCPPFLFMMFDFMEIPLLNTIILLSSGVTITISHFYSISGQIFKMLFYIFFTVVLGFIFSYFQFLEYTNSFFSYNDSCLGGCFFTLTGFHGAHVILGSLFLLYIFFSHNFFVSPVNLSRLSFDLSSWYWHFVDVVWIFLYFFVYIFKS